MDNFEKTYEDYAREEMIDKVGTEPIPSKATTRVFFTCVGFIVLLHFMGVAYYLNPKLWLAVLILCTIVYAIQSYLRHHWLDQCSSIEKNMKKGIRGF